MKLHEIAIRDGVSSFEEGEYHLYQKAFKKLIAKHRDLHFFESVDGTDGESYDIAVEVDDYQPPEPSVGYNYSDVSYNIVAHGWSLESPDDFSEDAGVHFIKKGDVELTDSACDDVKERLINQIEGDFDDPRIP